MDIEEDAEVLVRFPLTHEEETGPREQWSWLPGRVESQCGDEYRVVISDERLAVEENGERLYPVCFRDSEEIKLA